MKCCYLLTLFLIAELCLGQSSENHHRSRILVRFSDQSILKNVDESTAKFNIKTLDDLNQRNNVKTIRCLNPRSGGSIYTIEFTNPLAITEKIYEYYNTRYFHYVEPDYIGYSAGEIVPNDTEYFKQWSLSNNGSFGEGPSPKLGADINMQEAWNITTGNPETIIAILDSGLKLDHPEFNGRLWQDAEGRKGKDFANNDYDPTDTHGHGTNVTSIIAATGDNGSGYAGINWESKIMPLQILENNYGYYSWWAEAIYYATDNGAQVINMSVGGSHYSAVMEDAVNYATDHGAIIVACMMNENNNTKYYPAAYKNTIAVGSTSADDTRSDQFPWNSSKGSNYGPHIDLSAPGNYIYGLSHSTNSNFNSYWSGTSQAAPHVAGVISLLLAIDPNLTLESVRSILTNSSDDKVGRNIEDLEGWDQYHGYGRLNAYQALSSISSVTNENSSQLAFTLSPNPIGKGEPLVIRFHNEGEKIVSVFDSSGRLVLMNKTDSKNYSINSNHLESGAYIIKVRTKGLPMGSKKFIVE